MSFIISRTVLYMIPLTVFFGDGLAQAQADTDMHTKGAQLGFVVETDAGVARQQGGPHDGGGVTTGYPFFSQVPDMELVFKKRALHPGSAIGYHEQERDEIYYVLSGTGEFTMNGKKTEVGAGTAILTRPGNWHGLRQTGPEDLVIFIVYGKD